MLQINRRPGHKLKYFAENRKLVKIIYHQIFYYDHSLNQQTVQFSFMLLLHVIVFWHTHTN